MGSVRLNRPLTRSASKNPAKPGLAARQVATLLLTRVIDDQRNLDALCDSANGLGNYLALEPRDRGLARAIAITALRHRNMIEYSLTAMMDRPPPKRARFLIHTLHAAAAQILFLGLPDSAAVDLAVSMIGDDKRTSRFRGMANAVLRRMVREKANLLAPGKKISSPFPQWFQKKLHKDHGREKTALIAGHVTREPLIDITVKSAPEKWAERFGGYVLPNGSVRITSQEPIESLDGFDEGEWWVQDAAASIPAKLLNVAEGSTVLELCAAPGGKTAQLVHAGYDVTAVDISEKRLERLRQNLQRLELGATTIAADILTLHPEKQYDGVLLDAPCSSSGTIRRHPDVMWTKTAEDVRELAELQFKLFEKAGEFVKPGGIVVFSNCSIFKQEGEDLLARAVKTFEDLVLSPVLPNEVPGFETAINRQGALRTLPHHLPDMKTPAHGGLDGFFACRFNKA